MYPQDRQMHNLICDGLIGTDCLSFCDVSVDYKIRRAMYNVVLE